MKHQLADAQDNRIDILYGGSEEEILNETLKIARDALPSLKGSEQLLYVNSLIGVKTCTEAMLRVCGASRYFRKMLTAHFAGKRLVQKLEFLENIVVGREVRMVIINCFEDTSFNSRHRMEVLEWIKWLRDTEDVRVVICMRDAPRSFGAQGQIKKMSRTSEAIGAYEKDTESVGNESRRETLDDAPQTVEDVETIEQLHQALERAMIEHDERHDGNLERHNHRVDHANEMKRPRTPLPNVIEMPENDRPLENKDLAVENVSVSVVRQ